MSATVRRAYRIARHFGQWDVGAFLASMSWQQYQRLEWSFTADPPVEDRLDTLLNLILWRLSFMFGSAEDVTPFEEFRIKWDGLAERPDEDEDDAEPQDADAAAVAAALARKAALRQTLGVNEAMNRQELFALMTASDEH